MSDLNIGKNNALNLKNFANNENMNNEERIVYYDEINEQQEEASEQHDKTIELSDETQNIDMNEKQMQTKPQEFNIYLSCTTPVQDTQMYTFQKQPVQVQSLAASMGPNIEDFGGEMLATAEKEERQLFVRKVFTVLLIMLLITSIGLLGIMLTPLRQLFIDNVIILLVFVIIGAILILIVTYAFVCSRCSHTPPMNYVLLVLIVIGYVLTGIPFICKYSMEVIIYAFIATTIVVAICLGLAFTRIDFTKCIMVVAVAMMALTLCSLGIFLVQFILKTRLTWVKIAIMIGMCVLQSVMLIIELQMVLGGKQVELTTDMWAFGAYLLYSSILDLFYKLIVIIANLDDS